MYGRAFREPADGGWRGASEYKDIVAAGKYLQTLPTVDPKKIGLWGGAYGGFPTPQGLARKPHGFARGGDMPRVHDWAAPTLPGAGAQSPERGRGTQRALRLSPQPSISK